jgi:peptide/nickel transport system permease protein
VFTYLGKRILQSAIPLIVVVIGVFFLARLTGDPSSLYLPLSATPEMKADFAARNGLDLPILQQLMNFIGGAFTLDFGESMRTGESAGAMVLRAFPATLQLAFFTMLFAIIIAVVIGCWAALKPNGVADRIVSFFSMGAASVPDFWLAILGIWIFAISFGILPTSGVQGGPEVWILPVATLMMRPVGVLAQIVRGSMVTVLGQPYIKVAYSRGATKFFVVTRHALKNAAAPALTVAGDLTVGLINGAVVVESIFGWPGIGKLMIDSILMRDFPVLQAAVLVTAVAIFILNIIIDLLYAVLDPRVRPTGRSAKKQGKADDAAPTTGIRTVKTGAIKAVVGTSTSSTSGTQGASA